MPFQNRSRPPSRRLGREILTSLRSTRGGIYYIKSNDFKQVHYLDEYPIYICNYVPSHMIPYNEDNFLNTELFRGLVRREALDLLAYSYNRSETGNVSISGDLGLVSERYTINVLISFTNFLAKGEIEELVRLSYQALERNLEERSRTVINKRGLGATISTMNRGMRYEDLGPSRPPRPEDWNQVNPLHDRNSTNREYFEDEVIYGEAPLPDLHTREDPSASQRANPIIIPPPVEVGGHEQDTMKRTRPEVRFTLPRMQPVFGTADIAKEAQTSSARPNVPVSKTDDELRSVRQRLKRAKKGKEEAEKAKDIQTAFDLTCYTIPELEAKLETLLKQQRKEQEKSAAPVSQKQEDRRSQHTGVEMESEDDDDEGGSGAEAEYD